MNVLPAIDLRAGRCVRLLQGRFDRETFYSDDPLAIAAALSDTGCSDLHLVDLDGARDGAAGNAQVIRELIASTCLSVQLGGGLREMHDLEFWFDAGASRCVVGSIAVHDAATVIAWLSRFGADRIVLALDVRLDEQSIPRLATNGWTQQTSQSLWNCIDEYSDAGVRHILCTDIGRDGALTGPNMALYEEFVSRYPDIRLQASGGVRDLDDLRALRRTGASATITGRALHDGRIQARELKQFLRDA